MKKMIITAMAIVMLATMTSCSTEKHSVTKTVSQGSNDVYVTEQIMKDDKVIEEKHYIVTYATAEEAWAEVYGDN